MGDHRVFTSPLIYTLLLLAVVAAGCGGGSDTSNDAASTEPSAEFFMAGKNVSGDVAYFTKFGHESNAAERKAASKVLAKNLAARAAHNWKGQCATLSKHAKVDLKEQTEFIVGTKGPCPASLAQGSEIAPAYVLADSLNGRPISALRVKGNEGVALYHGNNKNYAMQMRKEHGAWKVDRLTTFPLPIPPKYK
jgi:hypothetical protein